MRRFSRLPYYTGMEAPDRSQPHGTPKLGETVIVRKIGGEDGDLHLGGVPELTKPRGSRPSGPFFIEDIQPVNWVAIEIIYIEVGPHVYDNNGRPLRGNLRSVAPVRMTCPTFRRNLGFQSNG